MENNSKKKKRKVKEKKTDKIEKFVKLGENNLQHAMDFI